MRLRLRKLGFALTVPLLLSVAWSLGGEDDLPKFPPTEMTMTGEWERVRKSEFAFGFLNPDTTIEHKMYLLSDERGHPLLFYADILTPVCIDDVCKPVYLEMYWDLLGRYAGYGAYPDLPLTKYDHDIFLSEDHSRLHELLLDRNSILDRKSLSDLYDLRGVSGEKIEYNGVEVDGISGATKTEIKSAVVSGALYTCYRLWHIAYGAASAGAMEFLESIYGGVLPSDMLASDRADYRYYALRKLPVNSFARNIDRIITAFAEGTPLVRSYLLKKMPRSLLGDGMVATRLYGSFSGLDLGTRTLLIDLLPVAPAAPPLLSRQTEAMAKNQLRDYLLFLEHRPDALTDDIIGNLRQAANSGQGQYTYLIEAFNDEHSPGTGE